MGLDALLARLAGADRAVTPVTPRLVADVTANSAPLLACTPVTSVTSPDRVKAGDARSARWLLHFADAEPLSVTIDPAITNAQVLGRYTGRLAAEPLAEPVPGTLPEDIAELVDQCIEAGLYGDDERALLAAMHATDAAGTRAIVEGMHALTRRCYRCLHFASPALSDGYCTSRQDLPEAYGQLRVLPPDRGANCRAYEAV